MRARLRTSLFIITVGLWAAGGKPLQAAEPSEVQDLRKEIESLRYRITDLEKTATPTPTPMPPAVPPNATSGSGIWSAPVGPQATLRLIDLSFDVLMAAGGSTENDQSLQSLQGGDHDPRKRGFTLQNVEFSAMGAVDPYVNGELHLVYFLDPLTSESKFELEEAFLTTQALPFGLQVKAGQYFTEFGRNNPTHPHAWAWEDQPVINTRLFGPDGLRDPGVRLAWLIPAFPWFSEIFFGVQNANGETASSFLANEEFFAERPVGNRPFYARSVDGMDDLLYSTRFANAFELGQAITAQLGLSGVYGPNATGENGSTWIYGGDLTVKWKPTRNFRGWPFVIFTAEAMQRIYRADTFFAANDPLVSSDDVFVPGATLYDYGVYAELLYGFYPRWAAGMRYDFANSSGQSLGGSGADPFRDERHRFSPLVAWYVTEFLRLRLQYNYDRADHLLAGDAHSVWAGMEFMLGSHPAHKF